MNNSTVNFTTPETSTNSTVHVIVLMDCLEIFMYSINLFFSPPMNCYIIWLIVTGSGIVLEFFTLNLSICEIGIFLNSLVFILSRWFSVFERFDFFLVGLTFVGRPLFQCLMCVERYLAVVHPVIFLKTKPLRYRAVCCSVLWIISLASCLTCMYNLVLNNDAAHAWFLTVMLMLVIFIQMFCLVSVLRALKQSGPGERRREKENHMKRRAFHLILITTVTMIILYFPLGFTAMSIIVTSDDRPPVWYASFCCFILAGFVQPVLYLHRAGKLPCVCRHMQR